MNKPEPVIRQPILNYQDIIDYIEEKYNIDTGDYAERFGGKGRDKINQLRDQWLKDNGYWKYKYVLNKPKGSKEDWAKDSEEMKLRVEINEKIWKEESNWEKQVPYLDYWHYILDAQFCDVSNGCTQYWSLSPILEYDAPEWVKEITQLIYDEFKEYTDEDGGFEVYISW